MNEIDQTVLSGITINHYLVLSIILFSIGVTGIMIRKNIIILIMCIELMLNAVNLLLVAFSRYYGDANGQLFVFFIMAVAAAEVAVGLAILIVAFHHAKTTNIDVFNNLKW
ncbi:MAG: NADH-quinone oxidoreductase subunit NuoK [Saprospiraceae bacterium]